jgi:uncharacterized membrane protein YidH (DUF202 family)
VDQGGIVTFPSYPAPAESRPRPTTVTVSTYLLWATAALSLISGIVALSTIGTVSDVYREAYAGTDAAGSEAIVVGSTVVGVVIGVLFAAALAVLAIFNNRGRNGARITTWVLGGISLCCTGVGLAGTALTSSMNLDTGTGGPSAQEIERRLSEALPSWYDAANWTLAGISLLTLLGALILLALPPSNEFFRAPQPAWDPSMAVPYPGQPPYPGQQAPGYPPYPGQPAYPPYPGQQPPAGPPAPGSTGAEPPAAGPPPSGSTGAEPPASGPPPSGSTGAEPPTSGPSDERRPPSDPTASA